MGENKEKTLADIMLLVFRLNGRLLEQGDRLVFDLGLTSARWQVLGAIALAGQPLTAPQVADAMGVTRQGAQKQLNLLLKNGLLERLPNPAHERSPLYTLSPAGLRVYGETERLCDLWTADLGRTLPDHAVQNTRQILADLLNRLDRPLPNAERTAPGGLADR